jgi:hypothetical protein
MRPRDLTGQTFGNLTVTGPPVRPPKDPITGGSAGRGIGWKCPVVCKCGRKEFAWYFHLVRGRQNSCDQCVQPKTAFR